MHGEAAAAGTVCALARAVCGTFFFPLMLLLRRWRSPRRGASAVVAQLIDIIGRIRDTRASAIVSRRMVLARNLSVRRQCHVRQAL